MAVVHPTRLSAARSMRRGSTTGLTPAEVKAIYQLVPSSRILAKAPSPADEASDVLCDAVLGWTASEFAATHDVYLGKTFADVNNASRTNPAGVLASQGQTATTFDPDGLLDYGQTYYWRIDEVNAAPDNTIFKGAIWSFTTEPYAYPLTKVTATASGAQPDMGPENTVNGSGLNANDQHSTEADADVDEQPAPQPNWIQYEFDEVCKLDEMWVWNSNQMVETFVGFGAKNVTIEYSVDGTTWTTLDGVPEFAQATGQPTYTANTIVHFGGVTAKYVKLTINSNWGGLSAQIGLSEVRFFYVPTQAREPQPAVRRDGRPLGCRADLAAGPGGAIAQGVLRHRQQAVADGTAPVSTVTDHSFTPAVAELRDDPITGRWTKSMTAGTRRRARSGASRPRSMRPIDDIESYNDDDNRIYETWIDGLTNSKRLAGRLLTGPVRRADDHPRRQAVDAVRVQQRQDAVLQRSRAGVLAPCRTGPATAPTA